MLKFLVAILLVASASVAQAQTSSSDEEVTYLFVQTAKRAVYDGVTLTLEDVNRSTIFFSDRPERIAGHMTTAQFLALWDEGDNSFAVNPPNATLSIVKDREVKAVVLVLRNPQLSDDNLSYEVEILLGERPKTFPAVGESLSLFIDTIGRPLSPNSIAGRHRRHERREDRREDEIDDRRDTKQDVRQERRDTKQDVRQERRDTKQDAKQERRDTKQDVRQNRRN